jgi:septal ring factor EnvC (AmiA/AmiB activator)
MNANLTIDSADNPGVNPKIVRGDEQHAQRQLEAGERVLTQVRREKNDLQDANTLLGVELKDVRAQLADSVKENKRLRRGILSKCLNEIFIEFGEETD